MSLARLPESHRVELFHFQLQDPAGSTQGCGLCYSLPGPPSWRHAYWLVSMRPRSGTPLQTTSPHLNTPIPSLLMLLLRPGHFLVTHLPVSSCFPHPPDLINACRRIVPPRRTFREDHLPTTVFSSSVGPSSKAPPTLQHMPSSFTKQLVETGPTSFLSHSGLQDRLPIWSYCPGVTQASGSTHLFYFPTASL